MPPTGFAKNITVEKIIEKTKQSLGFVDNGEKGRDMEGEKLSQTQLLFGGESGKAPGWSLPPDDMGAPPSKVYPSFTPVHHQFDSV